MSWTRSPAALIRACDFTEIAARHGIHRAWAYKLKVGGSEVTRAECRDAGVVELNAQAPVS